MYEQIFQLSSRPFVSMPFVKHYYPTQAMEKSLSSCRMCIDRGSGPVMVVGEAGTGKSLLMSLLEDQYRRQFSVVMLGCARLSERRELLQSILFELQLPYRDMSEGELRLSLMDYLKPSQACPNGMLLLVDEAQNLSVELLDEIRLITNFVRDGQPRVRLVMCGNQRLEERLTDPKLESFNQRLAARCYLGNLAQAETAAYVTSHVDRAGGKGPQMFADKSLRAIHELTDGCPRFINQLCDHAMILAATQGMTTIEGSLIREAWADVQCLPNPMNSDREYVSNAGTSDALLQSNLKDDEKWTVIEFGSLDDSDQVSSPATGDQSCQEDPWSEFQSTGFADESVIENPQQQLAEVRPFEQQQTEVQTFDPFAEEFEEEEEIADRYTPLIAAQNHSSMRLTADELSYLKPLDCEELCESINNDDCAEPAVAEAIEDAPQPVGSELTPPRYHDHVTEANSADAVRQAEEILKTLNRAETSEKQGSNAPSPVSCETPDDEYFSDAETIRLIDPGTSSAAVSFVNMDEVAHQCGDEESEADEQLLKEIIEEKNRISARTFGADCNSEQIDDRDILVINRQEEVPDSPPTGSQPIPFPATPVSTGHAKRMDYQQLFDQLRNMTNQ